MWVCVPATNQIQSRRDHMKNRCCGRHAAFTSGTRPIIKPVLLRQSVCAPGHVRATITPSHHTFKSQVGGATALKSRVFITVTSFCPCVCRSGSSLHQSVRPSINPFINKEPTFNISPNRWSITSDREETDVIHRSEEISRRQQLAGRQTTSATTVTSIPLERW